MECKDEIYSASQLSVKSETLCNNNNVPDIVVTSEESAEVQQPVTVTAKFIVPFVETPASTPPPRPQTATSKIFAPRTEEMSKGFLTFSEEEPGLTSEYSPIALCLHISHDYVICRRRKLCFIYVISRYYF